MRYSDGIGGFYELNPFPGCNQLVISNHSWIPKEKRGQGLGSQVHQERLAKIHELGYDYVLCTVRSDNAPQRRILENNLWQCLAEFENRETGSTVLIYGRKM